MQKDIVFIDTSVYIKEKYFSEGNGICTLFKLAKEGIIDLVSTDITNQELLRHMQKDCMEAYSKLRKQCNVLRNVSVFKDSFDRANKEIIKEEIRELIENNLRSAEVYSLGYKCSEDDVKYIFNSFFKNSTPFSEHKKSEFPDAFVLRLLDNYARKNRLQIVILSVDDDMSNYKSVNLVVADYKVFITEKLVVKEKLADIRFALDDQYGKICLEIKEVCGKALDDTNLYVNCIEGEEVSYVTVNSVSANFDKNSIYIYNEEGGVLGVEVECEIVFSVDVEFENTSNAYYDSEDKRWYGTESDTIKLRKSATTYVDLKYDKQLGLRIEYFDVDDVIREI